MKRLSVIAAAVAMCVAATSANAATVQFTLYLGQYAQGPGTFKLTAMDSTGDNFGIASYGVELVGLTATSILSANHDSLRAASATNNTTSEEGSAGFTLVRSPDKAAATPGVAALAIGASQDTVVPTPNLIRGFGQTAGSLASNNLTGPAQEGDNWGNAGTTGPGKLTAPVGEFEIARGTYTPGGNGLTGIAFLAQGTAATFANVFTGATGVETAAATVQRVLVVPEPATLGLGALSLLGLVAAARRRA